NFGWPKNAMWARFRQKREAGRLSAFVQYGASRLFHRFRQFDGSQNGRANAPTQNPTLDFRETGQVQAQLDAAVLQFGHALRGLPAFFTDVVSRQLVKANEHVEFARSGEDAKTVAQPLLQGEFRRGDEGP